MSIKYRVWNEAKTEYFETVDGQLAYEVRKGSDTNCWSSVESSKKCEEGIEFIYRWLRDTCTIEEVTE